jgi:hypothetical protein
VSDRGGPESARRMMPGVPERVPTVVRGVNRLSGSDVLQALSPIASRSLDRGRAVAMV